jgi:cation diffusion facilitator CzcD-associated flavoprotein CzcO
MCQGYYRHSGGYTPEWKGMETFKGRIVHPQRWPDDLDTEGKKVVVIGSGATAATLIPAIADSCGHVTMLRQAKISPLALMLVTLSGAPWKVAGRCSPIGLHRFFRSVAVGPVVRERCSDHYVTLSGKSGDRRLRRMM